ncbi:MAG: 30S ribosomal protein S8 [Candidatus Kaiserbacteria bacterium]|nr:30S ribosomal protein S8 [Candidatus Kaiserbacteria bacterium]
MDGIADLIVRIKNGGMVRGETVTVSYSKMRNSVAQKMRTAGYVADVTTDGHGPKKQLIITLQYGEGGEHRIHGVKRISKPGRRVYLGFRDIKPVRNGYGTLFLSTPKGILTGSEARKDQVGGEVLFSLW